MKTELFVGCIVFSPLWGCRYCDPAGCFSNEPVQKSKSGFGLSYLVFDIPVNRKPGCDDSLCFKNRQDLLRKIPEGMRMKSFRLKDGGGHEKVKELNWDKTAINRQSNFANI